MDQIFNFQVLNKFPSLSRVDVFLYFVDVISVQIDRYKILDFNNNNIQDLKGSSSSSSTSAW